MKRGVSPGKCVSIKEEDNQYFPIHRAARSSTRPLTAKPNPNNSSHPPPCPSPRERPITRTTQSTSLNLFSSESNNSSNSSPSETWYFRPGRNEDASKYNGNGNEDRLPVAEVDDIIPTNESGACACDSGVKPDYSKVSRLMSSSVDDGDTIFTVDEVPRIMSASVEDYGGVCAFIDDHCISDDEANAVKDEGSNNEDDFVVQAVDSVETVYDHADVEVPAKQEDIEEPKGIIIKFYIIIYMYMYIVF